ncbi:MAG: hypothetical protein NTW26_11090 [bacterium]|nr:hypothetical protein [bacterium]
MSYASKAARRRHSEPLGRPQVDFRIGLVVGHVGRGEDDREVRAEPEPVQYGVHRVGMGARGQGHRHLPAQPADQPLDARPQLHPVADELRVELVLRPPYFFDRGLDAVPLEVIRQSPLTDPILDEILAGEVMTVSGQNLGVGLELERFGVHQDAVQVEDDGLDHFSGIPPAAARAPLPAASRTERATSLN